MSILAIHPGALGDVVLFGHLLVAVGGEVTLVAGGGKAELLAGLGAADRALDFDTLPLHEAFADTPPAACRLPGRLGPCERLISCFGGGSRAAELRLAALCGAGQAAFLPVRPSEEFDGRLLDLWADLLGIDPATCSNVQPWPAPDAWRQAAAVALGLSSDRPYALLHPGAGAPDKCWPLERFVTLANELAVDGPVAFAVGPAERDRWDASALDAIEGSWPTLLCPDLPLLAGAVGAAKLFVGNDSGPAHLAAAVGTPTLALFGPTRPAHFAPVGRTVRTLSRSPLNELAVQDVRDAAAGLMR